MRAIRSLVARLIALRPSAAPCMTFIGGREALRVVLEERAGAGLAVVGAIAAMLRSVAREAAEYPFRLNGSNSLPQPHPGTGTGTGISTYIMSDFIPPINPCSHGLVPAAGVPCSRAVLQACAADG